MDKVHQAEKIRGYGRMITVKKERRVLADGTAALLVYEAESDELNVYFGENRRATGVQLADHILLRLAQAEGKAISLSFIDFSLLIRPTTYGPPSFRLDGLNDLPDDLREMTLQIISTPPVSYFLKVGAFYTSLHQSPIPISYIERQATLPVPV
jgi:hypothetical protein